MAALEDKEMAEEYVDTLLNKDDAELDKFLGQQPPPKGRGLKKVLVD